MKYTFTFTQQEIQIISAGLGEIPLKTSIVLFSKIQNDIIKQDNEQAISLATIQRQFDASVDANDMPSGQTKPKDEFTGD